jgi:hypothetical protein
MVAIGAALEIGVYGTLLWLPKLPLVLLLAWVWLRRS